LPNGNTLIVDSEGGQILEVAPSREIGTHACGGFVYMARRFNPEQLVFLKESPRPRP
jgi:hypothetical protein